MADLRGIEYLRRKLNAKRIRVEMRYNYYNMKNIMKEFNITMPPEWSWLKETLGWCGTAVDSLADRLIFRGWKNDNFNLQEIFNMNNKDIFFDSAVLSACISSCSFVYVLKGEDDFPVLEVIDGGNATGIIDSTTGMLVEGYAVLERDEKKLPVSEAYFTSEYTEYHLKGMEPYRLDNPAPYPLLVPIIHRPDAKREFGHSRITRACMDIQQAALRTLKRSEIAAEFYSFPQKWVSGLSQDAEEMDKWRATVSSFLQFDKDEDGDKPAVGQFAQQSMAPYVEQLRMLAGLFAGETGLTLDDLGFASDNPSSADAIKASHEKLRTAARKAQRTFGSGFLNVGYLAACVRDDYPYKRSQLYLTEPRWYPVFEPDAAMLSGIGDGAIKINQAIPGFFSKNTLSDLTGID